MGFEYIQIGNECSNIIVSLREAQPNCNHCGIASIKTGASARQGSAVQNVAAANEAKFTVAFIFIMELMCRNKGKTRTNEKIKYNVSDASQTTY